MTSQYFDEIDDVILSQIDLPDATIPHFTNNNSALHEHESSYSNAKDWVSPTPSPSNSPSTKECIPESPPLQSATTAIERNDNVSIISNINQSKHQHSFSANRTAIQQKSNDFSSSPNFQRHTDPVMKFVGRRKIVNTERKNKCSIRLLKNYIFAKIDFSEWEYAHKYDHFYFYTSRKEIHVDVSNANEDEEFVLLRKIMFPDFNGSFLSDGFNSWSDDQLKHVLFFLAEFSVRYRQRDGSEVSPNSMKGYIFGIQRFFSSEWNYNLSLTTGPVFGCEKGGLICILDNLFADQQSRGYTPESYNVLSENDIQKLYESPELSSNTSTTFQTRLIFNLALSTGMRISELHQLKCSQVKFGEQNGEKVIWIKSIIGSTAGTSKNAR